MSFLDNLTALLPFSKKTPAAEYFFALNIGPEKLTAALWSTESNNLHVISSTSQDYSATDEIEKVTDKLLDIVLGDLPQEPTKILFGVPDSWLMDDELKDPYLKLLRDLVKGLELVPMAYVATSHALSHFLEKREGSPATVILASIGKKYVNIFSVRAGKLDGTASVERGSNLGADIEKGILSGVTAEVLPSKMLIFGDGNLDKQKSELVTYPWMSKLSFLHLPKIEILAGDVEITAVCLAGAVEISPDIKFDFGMPSEQKPSTGLHEVEMEQKEEGKKEQDQVVENEDLGFIAGDVAALETAKKEASDVLDESGEDLDKDEDQDAGEEEILPSESVVMRPEKEVAWEEPESNPERELPSGPVEQENVEKIIANRLTFLKKLSLPTGGKKIFLIAAVVIVLLGISYIFIPRARVLVYVEPRILEKDMQVIADPSIKSVDEAGKKIPGESVQTQIAGTGNSTATGKKQVGNAAKGVVSLYNKADGSKSFPSGTVLVDTGGLKFTLDNLVTIASPSAETGEWGKADANVTAVTIGPDSNLPSGAKLLISGNSESQFVGKTVGNFAGGTSQDVTVVSDDDQKKLLASTLSDLRGKAVQELQGKLSSGKKVLPETLNEDVARKSFSKNVNDQAQSFTLNLTVNYKGTAFTDTDLKTMVAKLVETNVPDGFSLDIANSETQADVSKVDKDGKVTFTARFKAKLMPKIDTDKIRQQIIGRSPQEVADILKGYDNVLGSEVKISPALPGPLQRLPILSQNITIETGLK